MSDPFRDDKDAALARADALQAELDRTKAEKEALEAKLAETEDKAAKFDAEERKKAEKAARDREKDEDDRVAAKKANKTVEELREARRAKIGVAVGAVIMIAIAVAIILPGYFQAKKHRVWVAEHDKRELAVKRWARMLGIDKCVRQTEEHMTEVLGNSMIADPRHEMHYRPSSNMTTQCKDDATILAADGELPQAARDAFGAWAIAIDAADPSFRVLYDYYDHADWKEDNYASGPAKWAAMLDARKPLTKALADVRATALPAVHDKMHAIANATPMADKKARIELGLRVIEVADLVALAKRGKASRDDVQKAAAATIEAGKSAPLDVRRDLRSSDTLENLAKGGYLSEPDTYALWNDIDDDSKAPFPPLGEEPSAGCDGDGDGGF